jgi:hypothetical protein
MANPTNPFSWQMPTSTDLVTDLPADFEVFGQAVATSMADLLGGTSGQILSKASNTDMDFTWVTNDVGDITAVTAGTGITGGGTSGDVTVSFDQANFGGGQYAAGKNKVINGDMGIWQRGTTFTNLNGYFADRWTTLPSGTPTTMTTSQQTFTAGTAPVSGYEGTFFARNLITTVGTLSNIDIVQKVEDVRTFAGDTATLSFWAKGDSARTSLVYLVQDFGSGGSGQVFAGTPSLTISTSWTRYTFTFTVPSISGKTIGTGSSLQIGIRQVVAAGSSIDIWGVQLEDGSTATPFQTATGTKQGELAACQRYYWRSNADASNPYALFCPSGYMSTTTAGVANAIFPVQMRVVPTSADFSNIAVQNTSGAITNITAFTLTNQSSPLMAGINVTTGATTANLGFRVLGNNNAAAYVGFSAEL